MDFLIDRWFGVRVEEELSQRKEDISVLCDFQRFSCC